MSRKKPPDDEPPDDEPPYGEQLSFDDALAEIEKPRPGYLRHDASATEAAAAYSIADSSPSQRKAIYGFICAAGKKGLTDYEIRAKAKRAGVGLAWSSASARRLDLVRVGLVVDSGQRRATTTGRQSTVWVAKP